MLSQYKPHVHEGPSSMGQSASKSYKQPVSKRFCNTSKLSKVGLSQNPPKAPSGIPSFEGKELSKMANIVDLATTGLRISSRLDNKPKQKYGFFSKLLLEGVEACGMAEKYHIFLTRSNQHIQ